MCRTTVLINGFIEADRGCYQWFHRRTPTREQEICRTIAPINGFIKGGRERYQWFYRMTWCDAKEVGNREHHTPSRICVAFHLLSGTEKKWQVFIYFPIRLEKKFLDSGHCTLADSEFILLITEPDAMWSNCTK